MCSYYILDVIHDVGPGGYFDFIFIFTFSYKMENLFRTLKLLVFNTMMSLIGKGSRLSV